MAAVDRSASSAARWLGVHALVVGAGWFVVAFAGLVGSQVSDAPGRWVATWPTPLQGVGATLLLVAALPVAWPVYIAIGWYESGLAARVRIGDDAARGSARRLLRAQALTFALASALAGMVAWLFRSADGAGYVSLAWLPLAGIAWLHLRTRAMLTPSSEARSP